MSRKPWTEGAELDREFWQTGQCAGECCREIALSASPEQIAQLAVKGMYDAKFVVRHFIPMRLGWEDKVSGVGVRWPDGDKPRQQYRCDQWSSVRAQEGRGCASYDKRPWLCRDYGGPRKPCLQPRCTLRTEPIWRDLDRLVDDGGSVPAERVLTVSP